MVQVVIRVYTHIYKSSTKSTEKKPNTNVSLVKNRVIKMLILSCTYRESKKLGYNHSKKN